MKNDFIFNNKLATESNKNPLNFVDMQESETDMSDERRVHLRIVRQGRRVQTIVEGIKDGDVMERSLQSLLKYFKKKLCNCNGCAKDNVIILQGDHVETLRKYLVDVGGYKSDTIMVHGV